MAEGVANTENISEKTHNQECAVCLQPCVHPAQLPCGHIFCYLCVKGFANQNKRCAMCRQEIPRDFVEQPHLLNIPQPESTESFDGGYQWFYEGRNGWWKYDSRTTEEIEDACNLQMPQFDLIICGDLYVIDFKNACQYPKNNPSWWQYDERTSKELETSYKDGNKSIELLIAGFLYIVDFENMLQLRRNDPSRRRQVKRDISTITKKGVAGIRTNPPPSTPQSEYNSQEVRSASPTDVPLDNATPITPSNTPQSPTSGRESPNRDLQATVEMISNLRLDCNRSDNRANSESE